MVQVLLHLRLVKLLYLHKIFVKHSFQHQTIIELLFLYHFTQYQHMLCYIQVTNVPWCPWKKSSLIY